MLPLPIPIREGCGALWPRLSDLRANQIEVLVFWFLRRSSSRGKRRRHERRVGDARVNAPFQFCCGCHVRKWSALQAMPRRRLRGPPNGPKEVELTKHNSQRLSQDGLGSARSTSAPATIWKRPRPMASRPPARGRHPHALRPRGVIVRNPALSVKALRQRTGVGKARERSW